MKGFKIKELEYKKGADKKIVYDIEVEKFHNFIANNILVHNCMVYCGKKKYYGRVLDSEGTRYTIEKPLIKKIGIEIKTGGIAKWTKAKLEEVIPIILDSNEAELRDWLKSIKGEYLDAPLGEIVNSGGVNNLDYVLGQKGITAGAKLSIAYNNYIKDYNIDDIYQPIMAGDKPKKLHLLLPNKFKSDTVGFLSDGFTKEIDKNVVDYDTQFEKRFMKPLDNMTKCLGYDLSKETEELDDW